MSWYSTGAVEAEKMAASSQTKKIRNFYTKPGETATIRFLSPAANSFNYKRAFVKWAKGQKLLTSPGTQPDPFVQAGLQLQAAFAWLVIDRRTFEFNDRVTGEERKVGPRVMFFADGQRTRKQLLAFEREMLNSFNEDRELDNKQPVTIEEFNLTSYDIKVSKEQGAPWNFVAKSPRPLSEADKELVEKHAFDLAEELKPLSATELNVLLGSREGDSVQDEEETTAYSYSDEEEDTISFS